MLRWHTILHLNGFLSLCEKEDDDSKKGFKKFRTFSWNQQRVVGWSAFASSSYNKFKRNFLQPRPSVNDIQYEFRGLRVKPFRHAWRSKKFNLLCGDVSSYQHSHSTRRPHSTKPRRFKAYLWYHLLRPPTRNDNNDIPLIKLLFSLDPPHRGRSLRNH